MAGFTMVVPTYWGRAGEELFRNEKIVFDHPTSLNEDGTLARLLESLRILEGAEELKIVIISVPNDPQIADEVDGKVYSVVAPFQSQYDIICIDSNTIANIRKRLAEKGVSEEALELVNVTNYSAVRNMCSIAGILNSSNNTVFIDDDEVFADPEFLKKIKESLAGKAQGASIQALAGYYLQPETYRLNEGNVPAWRAPYWNNAAAMNEAFDRFIGQDPRIKRTPFVFGGNMTLGLEALKKVPFDPRITRGEDIDFLINLRINGIAFYLDRELAIKHLPPGSSRPAWKGLREDALRFLYERKKVMDHAGISLDELQPYPGLFLGADLEERIIKTNTLLKQEYESQGDEEGIRECEANIAMAQNNPFEDFDTAEWLTKLTTLWQELTAPAEGMGIQE